MRLSSLISPFPIAICASVLLGTPVYMYREHTRIHTHSYYKDHTHIKLLRKAMLAVGMQLHDMFEELPDWKGLHVI